MFFRSAAKTTAEEAATPSARSPKATAEGELDAAVEAFAGVLRTVGRFPLALQGVDPEQVADFCERWASHLLLRKPAPEMEADETNDGKGPRSIRQEGGEVRREWSAALKYVTGLRRNEHAQVTRALADLRQTIWAFVRSLNQALVSDGDADGSVKEQLVRLQTAARQSSPEDLRREAFAVAETVTGLVEQRKKRQLAQTTDLGARVVALGAALEEARREGTLDPLTRLSNRRAFDDALQRTADLAVFGQRMCLVLVDIDHFKAINDKHGHPGGDEVIKRIAECLVRTFRRRDDIVARYGGEEFAIILPDTNPKSAALLTERFLASVRTLAIPARSGEIRLTVSAGLSELAKNESPLAWLDRTDKALYEAKRTGRDRLVSSVEDSTPPPAEKPANGANV